MNHLNVLLSGLAAVVFCPLLAAGPLEDLMPRPKSVIAGEGRWNYAEGAVRKGSVPAGASVHPEAYTLTVTPDGAVWTGNERYAKTTLKQLAALGGGLVPVCTIVDEPTLTVRGMMHDTGRNWQPIDLLKKQLKRMADYKLNTFQWHLTDNHGWRLQSLKYPELSHPDNLDRTDCFYTQAEFRELIAYAHSLGITVIPELDVPGHTACFRRAFGVKQMNTPKIRGIVSDLFEEMTALLDPKVTPYIHIGSDEVKPNERVPADWLADWVNALEAKGFRVIGWSPGQFPKGLKRPLVRQYWTGRQIRRPASGETYIDSMSSYYINHVDPMELLAPATYQMPCMTGRPQDRLGAIFAVWHDDAAGRPEDVVSMNPVYPAMVLYSDNFWNGRKTEDMRYYGNLPDPRDPLFAQAAELERRTLAQKPFFVGEPFFFYPQTQMRWRMAETAETLPFANLPWGERMLAQGTVYPQHFFFRQSNLTKATCVWLGTEVYSDSEKTVDLIADFMNYSRSDGRKRDAALVQGQWNARGAKILLNGTPIPPPVWKQPGLTGAASQERPLVDEIWTARPPLRVTLKKGRNELLIKLPKGQWKWTATCFFPNPEGLTFRAPARKE